jgi:ABC-type uncharacterized transport system substrate-binding protein
MERELLLAVKDKHYSSQRVENEIEVVKKILPYIESCNTFCKNNEVFDSHRQKLVKNAARLREIFETGLSNTNRYFIICKN